MKKQVKKKISYLDYACKIGERVRWENMKKEKFEGTLIKMDEDYLAIVQLDDGSTQEIQC